MLVKLYDEIDERLIFMSCLFARKNTILQMEPTVFVIGPLVFLAKPGEKRLVREILGQMQTYT